MNESQHHNLFMHLEDVLNIMSDGIYITDKHGNTLFVNKMYEELTGLNFTDLQFMNVHELKAIGIFDTVLNPEVVASRKPATTAQQVRNGKQVVLRAYPVLDDDNDVALVVTFVRDITMITDLREQIVQQRQLIEQYHDSLEHIAHEYSKIDGHVVHSPQMIEVISLLKRVAPTDASILLLGETGVGKDVLARYTHENSQRRDNILLKVDCGSIAENLIESELFGYAPGAFSGASTKGKVGYFEMADKGTLFLDEIGELPLPMQAKLLRALQDKEIIRVGSSTTRKVDVRIIAATNKDLEAEVAKGNFRSDLFYRLRVAVVNIPPLRERHADIAPLIRHFIRRYADKYKKPTECSPATMDILQAYRWPGNVREMQNLIQSLVITSHDGNITPGDLPASIAGDKAPAPRYLLPSLENRSLKEISADIERDIIQQALDTHGSVSKVAKMFKVSRTTIFRKMHPKSDSSA